MIFPIKKKTLQRRRSKSNDSSGNIRILYEKRQKKGDSSADELDNLKSYKKKKRNSLTIKSLLVNNEPVPTLNSTVDETLFFKNPKNSSRSLKPTEPSQKNTKIIEQPTHLKLTKMSDPTPTHNNKYSKNPNRTILLSENYTKQKSPTEAGSKSSKSDASILKTDYLQVPNFFRKH